MAVSSRKKSRLSKSKRRQLRMRAARKARLTRGQLRRQYENLPDPVRSFFEPFAPLFRRPTFLRFATLVVATLLTVGCRTVCNVLRTVGRLAPGDPSSYHRFFSC